MCREDPLSLSHHQQNPGGADGGWDHLQSHVVIRPSASFKRPTTCLLLLSSTCGIQQVTHPPSPHFTLPHLTSPEPTSNVCMQLQNPAKTKAVCWPSTVVSSLKLPGAPVLRLRRLRWAGSSIREGGGVRKEQDSSVRNL